MKTLHEYRGFVFTFEYMAIEPAYIIGFPDIRNIITSGDTLDEAFHNACEALYLHFESMQKLGNTIPKPNHRLIITTVT